jgi:primosomal protein N' (replication factor Y)
MKDWVIQVCIPHTNRDAFDYLSDINVVIGARVLVPFRKQIRLGIVIALSASLSNVGNITLRKISNCIDDKALLSAEMLRLYQWIARYYQSPLSEVIPLALPKKLRLGHTVQLPEIDYYQLVIPLKTATDLVGRRKPKQLALINYLAAINQSVSKKTLLAAGFSQLHIKALLAHQILHHTMQVDLSKWQGLGHDVPLILNDEQAYAVDTIRHHLDAYHCFLLQGVTGSGKTEVYLHLIKDILARGRQVLVLVPEIGLTPQLLSRFNARFTEPMVVIHSNLNETERAHAWQAARIGTIKLVIGTRAAIFTPMPALGLIILDEEHDSSFKQMDGVRYFARDTALMRAYFANIPIILGSATPSLESIYNCQQKKYTRLWLNQKALVSTPLHYHVTDLRNVPIKHGLASTTVAMISTHLKQKNQVLVFINRRGFAPVLLCHQC